MATKFIHKSITISGNFHDVAHEMDNRKDLEGWELVAADVVGHYTICILRMKITED